MELRAHTVESAKNIPGVAAPQQPRSNNRRQTVTTIFPICWFDSM
jgi:hypothetical protein